MQRETTEFDWESSDSYDTPKLPSIHPGDKVKVSGWRGLYTVTRRPWLHQVFRGYVAEVQSESGRRVKALIDELTLVERAKQDPPTRHIWYRKYENTPLSTVGIRRLDIRLLVDRIRDVTPGRKVAKVTAIAKVGAEATFTVRQTKAGLATEGITWKSPKAHAAVLCEVRQRLLGLNHR